MDKIIKRYASDGSQISTPYHDLGNGNHAPESVEAPGTLDSDGFAAADAAAALPAKACRFAYVQNYKASAGAMLVGKAGHESIELQPGKGIGFQVSDLSQISVKRAAAGIAAAGGWAIIG